MVRVGGWVGLLVGAGFGFVRLIKWVVGEVGEAGRRGGGKEGGGG